MASLATKRKKIKKNYNNKENYNNKFIPLKFSNAFIVTTYNLQ
jgi:hypothetical protein